MNVDTFYQDKLFYYLEISLNKAGYASDKILNGYSDGPTPLGAYCVINITGVNDDIPPEVLYDYTDNPSKQIDENILYRATLNCTLDLYGAEVTAAARQVKALFFSSEMSEAAQFHGFGFRGYGDTTNLTEVRNGAYEGRAAFPFDLHLIFTHTELIQTIGTVRVSGETDLGVPIMDEIISE